MNRLRERIQQFMVGRYGGDQLSKALFVVVLVLLVLSMLTRNTLLEFLAIGLLAYSYFRIFSKNHSARYQENRKYLEVTASLRRKWSSFVNVNRQRKDFHIYTCPNKGCRQKIRVPKGKGKIEVTCPKCKAQFVKNS